MRTVSPLLAQNFKSSFLSCEKDYETILKKLLVTSKPFSDMLKRLLIINMPDCLDTSNAVYQDIIDNHSFADMLEKGYIRTTPRIGFGQHEEVRSYILLEFDDFTMTSNPEFRDTFVTFNIFCHLDHWEMDDFKIRPYQIAGYMDGILNESRLSGIGTLQFVGASTMVLDESLGGILLRYRATHGSDDQLPPEIQMTGNSHEEV